LFRSYLRLLSARERQRLLRLPFREPPMRRLRLWQQRAASSTSTRPSASCKQLLAALSCCFSSLFPVPGSQL